jgi:molybdopterin-guanine dinucleotide biosynthesis protein A
MGANIDKAFLDLDGQTLVARGLNAMGGVCDSVSIVGDPGKFLNYGIGNPPPIRWGPVIVDIFPGCGPLGGIHAALTHSAAELNLMLAVDMPFVTENLLAFLFQAAEQSDAVLTVPRAGGRLQPLCAIYRRAFFSAAEQALAAGNYRIDATFADTSVHLIEEGELAAAGFSERSFFNLNTPQDLLAAGRQ